MAKIRLKETSEIVEAVLDKNNEMACFLNAETDDFETLTSMDFELVEEAEETEAENDHEEYHSSATAPYPDDQTPMLTLANVLGGKLKSLTVEFK